MEADTKKKFQIIFAILILLALVRVGLIWKERHEAEQVKPAPAAKELPSDAYVVLPKLHAYDLASAKRDLDGKDLWVAAPDQLQKYPVRGGAVDLKHPEGTLPSLAHLHVQNVIESEGPGSTIQQGKLIIHTNAKRVYAIANEEGAANKNSFAVLIGSEENGSYDFNVNNAFFLADPHKLYTNWSADTWKAIENHEAKQGMSELQAGLALGVPHVVSGTDYGNRTIEFDGNGKKTTVTFVDDHATEIKAEGGDGTSADASSAKK